MHRNTLIVLLILCSGFLSLAAAQAQCGSQAGGISCASPTDCCSSQGYCGTTSDYCGAGCQPAFGASCSGGASATSVTTVSPAIPSSTSTIVVSTIPTSAPSIATTTTAIIATTIATTATTTTESASVSVSPSSTSTRGTFQIQPTGKPSGASASQDKKGVESRLALVIVFMAGLLMI
ncbi:hypothetical protein BGZ46_010505 [Entomortierella lignicola]|nr:hypothetical protein BGZ46_010505 [Entomortierella lignicola]